jgi:hypothetical protein
MRAFWTVALVCLVLGACRVDGGEPSDAYFPDRVSDSDQMVCEAHQMMCVDWETEERWCCTVRCSAGCVGGGCGTAAPYCQGCHCP